MVIKTATEFGNLLTTTDLWLALIHNLLIWVYNTSPVYIEPLSIVTFQNLCGLPDPSTDMWNKNKRMT